MNLCNPAIRPERYLKAPFIKIEICQNALKKKHHSYRKKWLIGLVCLVFSVLRNILCFVRIISSVSQYLLG